MLSGHLNTVRGPGGTEAGYGIACGTDGAGQNTLTANVYSNWVYDVNHAILLGGSTGCKAWSNYEENVSYGVVLKHSTSCLYYGNIVKSPTINGILFKYDTDSAAYYNTVIADVARSSSSVRVTTDGANNSSGCLIKGNLVVTSDAA